MSYRSYLHLVSFIGSLSAGDLIAQSLTVTLQSPQHNGFHISCFGARTGSITATVQGGSPPYTYLWSNNDTTATVTDLSAGYHRVVVSDAMLATEVAEITLTQPTQLNVTLDPYEYPNHYHISCRDCYNGSIQVVVSGGLAPYSYLWGDGAVTPTRSGLGSATYRVTVTDANGCTLQSQSLLLTQPDAVDWRMTGNAGTDPLTQYLGTSDNKDLVFKSNGTERLRLFANGSLKVPGFSGGGILKAAGAGTLSVIEWPPTPMPLDALPFWSTSGNYLTTTNEFDEVLGTRDANPLKVITHDIERLRITAAGRVGIGTLQPAEQFEVHHADERGGLLLRNTTTGNAHSEVRFNALDGQRWGLGCDFQATGGQDFFLWDEVASARRLLVNADGHLAVGNMAPEEAFHVQGAGAVRSLVASSDAAAVESWVRNSAFGYALAVDADGRRRILYDHNSPATAISIGTNGKVGIGVDPPTLASIYKLYVADGIATRDVFVTAGDWPDYVFADGYRLMPLSEFRAFLKRHRHLPGMPSATEVDRNEGVELGAMQVRLLKALEEQALYILHLEERIKALEERKD